MPLQGHNGCANKDLDFFFLDLKEADYVAILSPMYNNFFPAPLKALMDRFQRFCSAKYLRGDSEPIGKQKSVGLVITSGTNARRRIESTILHTRHGFKQLHIQHC